MTNRDNALSEILQPIINTLGADGYRATVADDGADLRIQVMATESACPDCLAPASLMQAIIQQVLQENHHDRQVHIIYPADAPGDTIDHGGLA